MSKTRRRAGWYQLLVLSLLSSGCAMDVESSGHEEDIGLTSDEIIGGTSLANVVATRRTMGLVTVRNGTGTCSGMLTHPDWVLTATHCLNTSSGFQNQFQIPRDPAAGLSGSGHDYDERFGDVINVLEGSDMSLVHLWTAPAGANWPNVTRSASATLPANLVGKSITCYGQGMTTYATPPNGTTSGGGTWKLLTKTVASTRSFLGGQELVINATASGNNIIGFGDSGGNCLNDGKIVSVVTSTIEVSCYDPTDSDTCKATTTKIGGAGLRGVYDFANYINEAPNRPLTWASPIGALESPWVEHRRIEYSSPDNNVVMLRGQLSRGGTGNKLFRLPSSLRPSLRIYVPVAAVSPHLVDARLLVETDGWVYVQFAGTSPNDVGVHLDGVSFSVKSNGFESLPLSNGWERYSTATFAPAVRKVDSTVYLEGVLKHPGTPSSMVAARLPSAYRPPSDVYVPVALCASQRGRVLIKPDGNITIQTENPNANPGCLTSLDGVSFRLSTAGTTGVSLQNGWQGGAYSTNNLSFVFDGPWVRFLGAVRSGTNPHVITLPSKFRPRTTQVLTANGCNAEKAWLLIATDGTVRAFTGDNGLPSCFVSFDGVAFIP